MQAATSSRAEVSALESDLLSGEAAKKRLLEEKSSLLQDRTSLQGRLHEVEESLSATSSVVSTPRVAAQQEFVTARGAGMSPGSAQQQEALSSAESDLKKARKESERLQKSLARSQEVLQAQLAKDTGEMELLRVAFYYVICTFFRGENAKNC